MHTKCLFCSNSIQLVFVHGHYQCPVCKTNALPCCDGDNCDNLFITKSATRDKQEVSVENTIPE